MIRASEHRGDAERALRAGEIGTAVAEVHEGLTMAVAAGAYRSMVPSLECLSRVLVAAGRHDDAARIHGACHRFRTERSLVPYPCLQRLLDDAATASKAALGDDAYEEAFAEGAPSPSRRRPSTHTGNAPPTPPPRSEGTRSPPPRLASRSWSPKGSRTPRSPRNC